MMLPNIWLWNMIDEFLYQFQSFAQYRAKLTTKSAEEIELLKKCDKVSDVLALVSCSCDECIVVAAHEAVAFGKDLACTWRTCVHRSGLFLLS